VLVVGEIALALILLVGSALLIRTTLALRSEPWRSRQRADDAHVAVETRLRPETVNCCSAGIDRRRAPPSKARGRAVPLEAVRPAVHDRRPAADKSRRFTAAAGGTVSAATSSVFKIAVKRGRAFTSRQRLGAPVMIIHGGWRELLETRIRCWRIRIGAMVRREDAYAARPGGSPTGSVRWKRAVTPADRRTRGKGSLLLAIIQEQLRQVTVCPCPTCDR
jgi:hypothetical protein